MNEGFFVTCFPGNQGNFQNYLKDGIVVHEPMYYTVLLRAMMPHAMGVVGSLWSDLEIMQVALPNKLYEYIAAGVVPVILNANQAWDEIKDYGFGVNLDPNLVEQGIIRDQLGDMKKQRENLLKVRKEFEFENQLPKILEMYRGLV
jgi:glycosyltransferase involved in cell wall biosynthesis